MSENYLNNDHVQSLEIIILIIFIKNIVKEDYKFKGKYHLWNLFECGWETIFSVNKLQSYKYQLLSLLQSSRVCVVSV